MCNQAHVQKPFLSGGKLLPKGQVQMMVILSLTYILLVLRL